MTTLSCLAIGIAFLAAVALLVFAGGEQTALEREESRGVQAAGLAETRLRAAQGVRQPEQDRSRDFGRSRHGRELASHGLDRALAAEAARGGGDQKPPRPVEVR